MKRALFALAVSSLAACASQSATPAVVSPLGQTRSLNVTMASAPLGSPIDLAAAARATPTPTPTPVPAVAAASGQSFVDSVGTNVHLAYYGSPYDPAYFSTLQSLLVNSGIKHLRDGMPLGQSTIVSEMQQLASSGIRFDYTMTPGYTSAQLSQWFASLGSNVAEACEGDNEPDLSGDANWVADDKADQQTLYGVCHPLGLMVGTSAMGGGGGDYAAVGNESSYADIAVMHNYYGWRNPGTAGTDQNGYGSLSYNMTTAAAEAPGKGVAATETGYDSNTSSTSNYLPEAIRARYLVRTLLEDFRAGVPRTYTYEFVDEGGVPYDQMGLVTSTGKTKPAYSAIQGILGYLADGTSFTPGSLAYTLTGNDSALHTVLFEKSDGTYWLALWKEAEEYAGDNVQQTETISAENVTVSFKTAASAAKTYVLQDSGSYTATTLKSAKSYALAVDGHPTLLQLSGFPK